MAIRNLDGAKAVEGIPLKALAMTIPGLTIAGVGVGVGLVAGVVVGWLLTRK